MTAEQIETGTCFIHHCDYLGPALFEISSSSAAGTTYEDDDAVVSKDTAMCESVRGAGSTSGGGIQCILLAPVRS
jgi:hypothetical protein